MFAFFHTVLDMAFNSFSEVFLKLFKAVTFIEEIFVDEENLAVQRIISGIYLNSAVISLMNYGFLCQNGSPCCC